MYWNILVLRSRTKTSPGLDVGVSGVYEMRAHGKKPETDRRPSPNSALARRCGLSGLSGLAKANRRPFSFFEMRAQ